MKCIKALQERKLSHGNKSMKINCMYAILIVLITAPALVSAQTGIITGTVRDADTGETLPGANILISGTTHGVSADIDGRYTLRSIPAGDHVLVIRYIGFSTQEIPITIEAGQRLVQNVSLQAAYIEGDEILVHARQRGQARALTLQRQSINIKSVVSSEQIDRFADQTVSGALQRVAGMGHGGTNIRGVGSGMSNVVLDGQRMGSTGTGDRSVSLNTISADMVQELEVIKVITPDMDASALSGVINVNTRRPVGGERSMNARLGGGFQDRYVGFSGPQARASFSYGDSPSDLYSFGFNVSYQRDPRGSESIETRWDNRNFGEGPRDVLDDFRTELEVGNRDRYGAGLQFTFQPTERSTYHIQTMFNYQDRWRHRHGMRYDINNDRYTSQYETGPMEGNEGRMHYSATLNEYQIHQYTTRAGARHLFNGFDLEYSLGWGHGRYFQESLGMPFNSGQNPGYDFLVNIDDRWHPTIEIAPWGRRPNYPESSHLRFSGFNNRIDNHVDNQFNGNVDVDVPLSWFDLKFGSSAQLTFKSGTHERFSMSTDRRVGPGAFGQKTTNDWRLLGRAHETYHIPWVIDLNEAKETFYNRYPYYEMDLETWASNSETENYSASEHVFAGYGMTTFEYGRFKLLGGARVEHTEARYEGREGTINSEGRFAGAHDVSSSNSYTYLFPNAQFIFSISRRSNFRMAYSKSIGRPNFNQLSPYILWNYSSESINFGNPDLKPMISNNFDALIEHYFMNVGHITVGVFYKELSDFVYSLSERIRPNMVVEGLDFEDPARYVGWNYSTYRNGDEATVFGVELSWQQYFGFLPGFLGNFGVYANYAYAHSVADIDRNNPAGETVYVRLEDQRPHVVNVGLDYTQGGFSAQVSYQWGAPSVSSYASTPQWAPEIQLQERVFFDRYRDAANDVSATVRYRLTSNFRLWADASNILNHRSVSYTYNREFYPRNASLVGRRINMGIHYTF